MTRGRRRKSPRNEGRPWRPSLEFSTLHIADDDGQLENSPVLDQSFRTLCFLLVPDWFLLITFYVIWTTSIILGPFAEQLTAGTPLAGLDFLRIAEIFAHSWTVLIFSRLGNSEGFQNACRASFLRAICRQVEEAKRRVPPDVHRAILKEVERRLPGACANMEAYEEAVRSSEENTRGGRGDVRKAGVNRGESTSVRSMSSAADTELASGSESLDVDNKAAAVVRNRCANGTNCPLSEPEPGKRKQRYLKCGKCRLVSYCSVECQHSHWPEHRGECKDCTEGQPCMPSTLPAEVAVAVGDVRSEEETAAMETFDSGLKKERALVEEAVLAFTEKFVESVGIIVLWTVARHAEMNHGQERGVVFILFKSEASVRSAIAWMESVQVEYEKQREAMVTIPVRQVGDEWVESTMETPLPKLFLDTAMEGMERLEFCTIQELRDKEWANDPEAVAKETEKPGVYACVFLTRVRVERKDWEGKMRTEYVERVHSLPFKHL